MKFETLHIRRPSKIAKKRQRSTWEEVSHVLFRYRVSSPRRRGAGASVAGMGRSPPGALVRAPAGTPGMCHRVPLLGCQDRAQACQGTLVRRGAVHRGSGMGHGVRAVAISPVVPGADACGIPGGVLVDAEAAGPELRGGPDRTRACSVVAPEPCPACQERCGGLGWPDQASALSGARSCPFSSMSGQ